MSIVWLWTDIALWVLTLLSIFAVYKIKKSESLSRKWISIFSKPIALSSFIIFVFYIFIGLSDSIHLRDSKTSEVYSLLDFALMPVMESFFSIPGLGSYTIDAINAQDFAIVRAMVFLGSVLYIIGLLLTDISYTFVDPRVKFK